MTLQTSLILFARDERIELPTQVLETHVIPLNQSRLHKGFGGQCPLIQFLYSTNYNILSIHIKATLI